MLHKIDTVIVGGGQAGLAVSYYLTQEGREHVALERAPAVANAWRNQRWDSFTLVTSNFQVRMPGAEYSGNDPYGFMSLAEVVEYFDNYIERFRLPVLCGVEVFSVERSATDMSYVQARRTMRPSATRVLVVDARE
jgi:putative flavoprotein involved in K+ transport